MAEIARETLNQLEWRLSRIEFYLRPNDGYSKSTQVGNIDSVQGRLAKLERKFTGICQNSTAIAELVELNRKYPELFQPEEQNIPDKDAIAAQIPIVMSLASDIDNVTAQLHLLRENSIQDAAGLTPLLDMQAKLVQAELVDAKQAHEVADLRQRTARVLADWYTNSVLGQGEQWSEWESRLTLVEQSIRRREVAQIKHEQQI